MSTTTATVLADLAGAAGLGPDEVDLDDELVELGLDSISLMTLLERWRGQGVELGFADLAACRDVRAAVATVTAAAAPAD